MVEFVDEGLKSFKEYHRGVAFGMITLLNSLFYHKMITKEDSKKCIIGHYDEIMLGLSFNDKDSDISTIQPVIIGGVDLMDVSEEMANIRKERKIEKMRYNMFMNDVQKEWIHGVLKMSGSEKNE